MLGRVLVGALSFILVARVVLHAQNKSRESSGQQVFSARCAGCHGLDGRGGEHAPNIATNANVQHLSETDLARIIRNGIPAAGMPAFASSLDNSQINALVKHLRTLQGESGGAPVAGDPGRGQVLFFGRARCSECHMVNGHGGFIGVDLSVYGKNHSPATIRESLMDPGKSLDQRHGTVLVTTKTGKKYSGVVRNEDNFSLQMQSTDGTFHLFDKSELARVEHQARSIMPSQNELKLTGSEVDDLISFLVNAPGTQRTQADEEEQ